MAIRSALFGGILLAMAGLTACDVPQGRPAEGPDGRNLVPDADAASCSVTVKGGQELVIRRLSVVEDRERTTWNGDPNDPVSGAWHFGKLMTHMAGSQDPSLFVQRWLNTWRQDRTLNGQSVPARRQIDQIISSWPKLANGRLDLTKSPMRLLAIVNRMDLRSSKDAGEGRFVFGVLDDRGFPMQFTVILEYDLPHAAMSTDEWAAAWHDLGALDPTTAAYNDALQVVTDAFSGPNADPGRPNGSAISQVRTNEIALAGPWELREFRLNSDGRLVMRPVALTPEIGLNGSSVLADFINSRETAILEQRHGVPNQFQGLPFRGAAITNNIDFWDAPGIDDPDARHLFSLNTCNGCHGAETSTGFLHINPRDAGRAAQLSGFMTGTTVSDPVTGELRTFNDIRRRRIDFQAVLCGDG